MVASFSSVAAGHQPAGDQLKQMGLDLVSEHNPDFIELVRSEAVRYCQMHGTVAAELARPSSQGKLPGG